MTNDDMQRRLHLLLQFLDARGASMVSSVYRTANAASAKGAFDAVAAVAKDNAALRAELARYKAALECVRTALEGFHTTPSLGRHPVRQALDTIEAALKEGK